MTKPVNKEQLGTYLELARVPTDAFRAVYFSLTHMGYNSDMAAKRALKVAIQFCKAKNLKEEAISEYEQAMEQLEEWIERKKNASVQQLGEKLCDIALEDSPP
jgi:hypothetical protein